MNKIKNLLSYIRFVFKYGRIPLVGIIVDTIILIIAIVNWEDVFGNKSILVILGLIFSTYLWQLYNLLSHFDFLKSSKYTEEEQIVPVATLPIPYSESLQSVYHNVPHERLNFFIESDEYNKLLKSQTPIVIQIQREGRTKEQRVKGYISAHFDELLPFLNNKWRHGSFFNEEKLCMASEFTPTESGYEVQLGKGCYYMSYLTNGIYNVQLAPPDQSTYIRPFCSSQTDVVESLQNSALGDHIGVSTILITKDDYIVFLFQNKDSAFNKQTYISSGSGSVDWADYKPTCQDLRDCIIGAVERELMEEMFHKVPADKCPQFHTEIVGFYRDLRRGGKPEFCCQTRVEDMWCHIENLIHPNKQEQTDRVSCLKLQKLDNGYAIHPDNLNKWLRMYDLASPTLLICLYNIGVKNFNTNH